MLLISFLCVALRFADADYCPGFSDCSSNGVCVIQQYRQWERVAVGCTCFNDDLRGHFGGAMCDRCSYGYLSPSCKVRGTSNAAAHLFLRNDSMLMMGVLAMLTVGCGVLLLVRVFVGIVYGRPSTSFDMESQSDAGEPLPLLDEGEISSVEQQEREAHLARMAELVGDHIDSFEETSAAEEGNRCKICFENEINCVLLECGHLCACFDCGKQLKQCPFCRQRILKVKKTFKL
eukprot:NODE_4244_length_819_cov_58.072254_g4086_i0.p1 GENE.NODE_4244_length_819_cov_58.072254_g4086_i0~~NODE_4244_length_819_cov_58.072254_g4086_i0.p1  ORF type:complete len:233 (+),score=47.28 NODE_4244_length_819_cov_58.072254_g4086_i0:43-741(+)